MGGFPRLWIAAVFVSWAGLVSSAGCASATDSADTSPTLDIPPPYPSRVEVFVTLDGAPAAGIQVLQGGNSRDRWWTDSAGRAAVDLDLEVQGEFWILAAHPRARTRAARVDSGDSLSVALETFADADNPDYRFDSPGKPPRDSSAQCSHCHRTLWADWAESAHRHAASNPTLWDLYRGTALGGASEADCEALGGTWAELSEAGKDTSRPQCAVGGSVLSHLNECSGAADCEENATAFGECANCHAPAIDGVLGGRALTEAKKTAFEFGVHCDFCHKIESIDLEVDAGVGGRLRLHRPSEPGSVGLGEYLPLTFGPYADVGNVRMGGVQRAHFHQAELCAGCHEYVAAPFSAGIELARWPAGKLPIHTTYSEWKQGPLGQSAPCQSCHMPPNTEVANAADLEILMADGIVDPSLAAGWLRPPGEVRHHTFAGPRYPGAQMLALAAAVYLETERSGAELVVRATVENAGPGHAIPTGEPMRSLVLSVSATCGEEVLEPSGGDVVPDFGGFVQRKSSEEDWTKWEQAEAGDWIVAVSRSGEYRDYKGFGPFGDGTFSPAQKGMPVESFAGRAKVTSVAVGGVVALDRPLPNGEIAYLLRGVPLVEDQMPSAPLAGTPGFAFARVLANAQGKAHVPHYEAVDVRSDNRLLPRQRYTTEHRFLATCDAPRASAVLAHRAYPWDLARHKGWPLADSVMASAAR